MKTDARTASTDFQRVGLILLIISTVWLWSCQVKKADNTTAIPDSVYIRAGDRITAVTFDTLRKSLLEAISTVGLEGAISFCNTNASGITQQYADTFQIRRTTLRYRNPGNRPDSLELIVLGEMTQDMQSVKVPGSRLVADKESVHYFRPIITQGMCVSCHGRREQIPALTVSQIDRLYPHDKAVNFKEGDLRGMWHITFKRELTKSQ